MPMSVRDAVGRRDEARWRTRRLSWLIAAGAASASVALGVTFSQLLPGHSAAASAVGAPPGEGTPAPAGGSGAPAASQGGLPQHHPAQSQPGQPRPTQAPVSSPAPPQAVSGGS